MSKSDTYTPPALPADVLPDLDIRIGEIRGNWERHKHQGYLYYQKARAQQAAAEDALHRGNRGDHDNLMNGLTSPDGQQRIAGVKALDAAAQIEWAQARRYRAELDVLEAERAAQTTAE